MLCLSPSTSKGSRACSLFFSAAAGCVSTTAQSTKCGCETSGSVMTSWVVTCILQDSWCCGQHFDSCRARDGGHAGLGPPVISLALHVCWLCVGPCRFLLDFRLGDARYLSQQLPAAKALYKQALQLRQLCCGPLTRGQAGPQEQLELAASLVKLADVCKVGFSSGYGIGCWDLTVVTKQGAFRAAGMNWQHHW